MKSYLDLTNLIMNIRVKTCYIETKYDLSAATLAGLAVLRGGEAHLALAAVTARGVQTLAVLAQVHVVGALVHVWKTTHAQERPKSAGRPSSRVGGFVCGVQCGFPHRSRRSRLR